LKTRMNIWDRFWNWAQPWGEQEILESVAREELLREQARLMRVENDRLEALVAKEKAQQDREEARMSAMRGVATIPIEFSVVTRGPNGETLKEEPHWLNMELNENLRGEREALASIYTDDGARKESNQKQIIEFLEGQDVYTLFIRPWRQGVITTEDLRKIKTVRFVGETPKGKKSG